MSDTYDLIIIGAGSAGLTAANFAARLGVRVALVEKHRIGGDCTWTGCVPSKTLLKAARVAHQMRTADRYGLNAVAPEVDLKRVMDHVRSVIAEIYEHESPEVLRSDGIEVFLADAHFLDPHTLAVGEQTVTARRVVIATGAGPLVPPIDGLEDVEFLTYESIWDLETLPQHLVVVGAGPVGCEFAQAFRRLGSRVTLVEALDRILPLDERQASSVLAEVFEREGIELRLEAKVERAWQDGDDIHLIAGGEELVGDALLIAIGRRPNVEGLGLEQAGVNYSETGIEVDDQLRTSQDHIYAAGDCIGSYQFTHYAGWQAFMAARNALLPGRSKGVSSHVPWTTFTDPEVAHVGLTEAQAREKLGDEVMTCEWPMGKVDRAVTDGKTAGFIKIVHQPDGTLLGASIVAGQAGEMINEWVVALEHGLKVGDLAEAIHVYPTYSSDAQQAAADVRVEQLLSGASGRLIRGAVRLVR